MDHSESQAPTSALLLRANVDRLIAGGRVVLASLALVVLALDPLGDIGPRFIARIVVALYLAGALAQLAIVMSTLRARTLLTRAELVGDAVFIAALTTLTGGTSATVFSFFVFFIVETGLRRSPRAVLVGGVVYFSIFVGATLASGVVTMDPPLEMNRIVVRGLLLALSTAALTIFAVERDRLLESFKSMTSWPLQEWTDLEAALTSLLRAAAPLAPRARVALVWADGEEPWTNVALLDGDLKMTELPPSDEDPLGEIGADDSFICTRLDRPEPRTTRITPAGVTTMRGVPLSSALVSMLSPTARSVVGVPVNGQIFSGHLLVLDRDRVPSDFVLRAEIVARQLAASLDIWLLSRRDREVAARDERARVWRDLHDGVVQSLTGLALMLARAEQSVEHSPADARRILREAAALLHDEQRDLRLSILEQKAAALSPSMPEDLSTLLGQVARRVEQVWGLSVELEIAAGVAPTHALALQVARMIQEALSNSARHGRSTRAVIRVVERDDTLHVTIEDNGKGFSFVGSFTHDMLVEQRIGPILLKDRVQRLHGTLDIRSARSGVGLDIRIPLRAARLAG